MLYNALIGNRDDHLRNFTLLHDDTGWRLSPGYDITPLFPPLPAMESEAKAGRPK
ncbi:HipA domain-containing protein [Thiolapillus sp.]|uniref:HipA domain-containing protein n=1 Tax=Thiolapillus sp. TaxID=2017437 RepID=UPI003AF9480F